MAEENQAQETKRVSEYERKKLKKEEEKRQRETGKNRKGAFKTLSIIFVLIALLGGGGWFIFSQEPDAQPDSEIIAKKGIHWHPELSITINGEKLEIPTNIGMGITHSPIHTHDPDGVIHLEFSGVVRTDDIQLGRFFKEWDKIFTSECIFEFCNGEEGTMTMTVNGEPNTEFENYIMKDGDKIEITFGEVSEESTDEDSSQESTSSEPKL